jgi:hypothetical protein
VARVRRPPARAHERHRRSSTWLAFRPASARS